MITWHPQKRQIEDIKFSIVIPTWNNLEMLQTCIDSIKKNSTFTHQIIIHVNDGTDGTLDWVNENGFDYTHSVQNVGVCWAMNACRSLMQTDYLVFLNDDMYVLPKWDLAFWKEIERLPDNFFFLSSSTIEPRISPHPGILAPYDYGTTPNNFREKELLAEYKDIPGTDWNGATWPPNIVHVNVWDIVGGYSIEYFPGLYSDPDFSMKLYEAGVRYFKGVDASRAYHFGSKSTRKIKMNKGSKQFLNKWGITSASFTRIFLKRGQSYEGPVTVKYDNPAYKKAKLKSGLKRFLWSFSGIGRTTGLNSYNKFEN
jgi:glycosyltransferase involved in cell wall biosynthesis